MAILLPNTGGSILFTEEQWESSTCHVPNLTDLALQTMDSEIVQMYCKDSSNVLQRTIVWKDHTRCSWSDDANLSWGILEAELRLLYLLTDWWCEPRIVYLELIWGQIWGIKHISSEHLFVAKEYAWAYVSYNTLQILWALLTPVAM